MSYKIEDQKCDTCFYHRYMGWIRNFGVRGFCDYIGVEQHRRPCPPGEECTVYIRKEEALANGRKIPKNLY